MPTVLIADDSAVARHRLAAALRAAGVDVVEASGMKEALEVHATRVDAAILDLDLGDGDGVAVADALRAQRADLPLAFYSSETEGPLYARAKAIARVYAKERCDDVASWAVAAARTLNSG